MESGKVFERELELQKKPTAPSLSGNVAWSFAGNILFALLQWSMFIILARRTSEVEVGQLALALAITTPVFTLTNLHLCALIATDASDQFTFREYRWLRICGILVAAVLSGLIGFLVADVATSRVIVLLFVLGKVAESCSDLLFGYLQRAERMDRISQSLILRGTLSCVAGVCGALSPTAPAIICAAVYALGRWLVLALFDIRHAPVRLMGTDSPGSTPRIRVLLLLALPMGVSSLLVSLDLHIVRIFLQLFEGEHRVGVFSMLTYFAMMGGLVFNAIGQSLTPRFAKHVQAGQPREFFRLWYAFVSLTAAISVTTALMFTFWGASLLTTLYGPSYAAAADSLLWLMWGTAIRDISSPFGYAVTSMRCFKPQPVNLCISIAVVAAGCCVLIPSHGLTGASQAYCAGMLSKAVGLCLILAYASRRSFVDAPAAAPVMSLGRAA